MDISQFALLAILSLCMGGVNSITGGGGVFGVPALMAMGIPPINALALNRWADIGNLIGSLQNYMRIKDFNLKKSLLIIPPMVIGAVIGVLFIVNISEALRNIIVLCAVVVGVLFLLYPAKSKDADSKENLWLGIPAIVLLGFWDGAFAMAGGTFGVLILVTLFKRSYLGAKSSLTLAQLPETIVSVSILTYSANIMKIEILTMIAFSIIGAYLGSKLAIKKGNQFIRYGMVLVALLMAGKVLFIDIL